MPFSSARHEILKRQAARIVAQARRAKLVMVTVESCTAGHLVALLSLQHRAADALAGGFVVYSTPSKARMLGVPSAALRRHTPVSEYVAIAMAQGALRRSGADIGVAVTGVAGPTRDADGNPVGLAFVAVATRAGPAACRELRLGSRDPNRNLLAMHRHALEMLLDAVVRRARRRR